MSKLIAKSPIDFVAISSVALGFTPVESVVMHTFGPTPFHGRVDLPDTDEDYQSVVDALLDPCLQHDVTQVVFVLHTERTDDAMAQFAALRDGYANSNIPIVEFLVVTDGQWQSLLTHTSGDADISNHPFLAQTVLDGRVTQVSRDDLRTIIAERDTLPYLPTPIDATGDLTGLQVEITDMLATGAVLTDTQLGTMLAAQNVVEVWDTMLAFVARHRSGDTGPRMAAMLGDVAARAPREHRARALAMHAYATYMNGNGAAAWISVDAAKEMDPDNQLAKIVAAFLTRAVPPAQASNIF